MLVSIFKFSQQDGGILHISIEIFKTHPDVQPALDISCLIRADGADDLHKCLPASTFLRFCDPVNSKVCQKIEPDSSSASALSY